MAAHEHEMTAAAREVLDELRADVGAVAGEVFGDQNAPDGVKQSRAAFLDYVRRNWPNPQFRATLFQQLVPVGPTGAPSEVALDHWDAVLKAAFPAGWAPPPPASPLNALGQGGELTPTGAPVDHAAALTARPLWTPTTEMTQGRTTLPAMGSDLVPT